MNIDSDSVFKRISCIDDADDDDDEDDDDGDDNAW